MTLADATDELLLDRIAAGDSDAFARLFHRWARIVRGIAGRILRDAAEADDLVQDLFLFIRSKCTVFDDSKGPADSWIVQMAYQRAIERRRRLVTRHFYKREDVHTRADQVIGMPTTEEDYSADAVFGRTGLEKIVGELSVPQRETLLLYFFEGYTLSEIADKTGQTLGNVRNHYYRALQKLRQHMFGRKVEATVPYGTQWK